VMANFAGLESMPSRKFLKFSIKVFLVYF